MHSLNLLIVGSDKTEILNRLPDSFLLVDDGPMIDAVPIPKRRKVTTFDVTKHSFNPLQNIDYLSARNFVDVINSIFPEGKDTLTKRSATYFLLEALLNEPDSLETLFPRAAKEPGKLDARQKILTLLLSPVLRDVLTNPTNFPFKGIILVRLDRAELGDFDCFVIANLLISQYEGQVVIPDFGFYSCPFHTSLIRQDRLIAGVNYLDETPLKNDLLLIDHKIGQHCTAEDAETLADHAGIVPHTNAYVDFVQRRIE